MRGTVNHPWVVILIVLICVVVIACIAVIPLIDYMTLKLICASLLFAVPWCCAIYDIISIRLNRLKDKGDI